MGTPKSWAMAMAAAIERRWIFPFLLTLFALVIFLSTLANMGLIASVSTSASDPSTPSINTTLAGGKSAKGNRTRSPPVPRLAYLVSGSKGDVGRLWRTLRAIYHPRNLYLLHLDLEAPPEERLHLSWLVGNETLYRKAGNVDVIAKANMVTYRGPTMVSNTLHACALLLRRSGDWDWFINLSASDYPLVTQDDLLFAFSNVPRNINFVEHTGRLGWKLAARARPLMMDPGLYSSTKTDVFFVRGRRNLPSAFRLFTGSAWMALTREFVEYCVWGYENLPRTLLMYYANFVSSPEGYFHTVICNAPSFNSTVANHDLHYIKWDVPPQQHPRSLGLNDTEAMIASNAAFARKFPKDDPVLLKIDAELLGRRNGRVTRGGWCKGTPKCSEIGNTERLKPGPGAKRLAALMAEIARPDQLAKSSCR